MKKVAIIIAITSLASLNGLSRFEHGYTRDNCKVIEATATGAIIEDRTGNTWYYEAEGFNVGDIVDMRMHDNWTPSQIKDDKIMKVIRK